MSDRLYCIVFEPATRIGRYEWRRRLHVNELTGTEYQYNLHDARHRVRVMETIRNHSAPLGGYKEPQEKITVVRVGSPTYRIAQRFTFNRTKTPTPQ
jgi:5-bromo-4-chloroindolyl phosphate hydrolysis protein